MIKKKFLLFTLGILFLCNVHAQVSIIGTQLQHFNVTPNTLLEATIINNGPEQQVILESKLFNTSNELLMNVRSAPFLLRAGLNAPATSSRQAASVEYGNNNQASYVRTSHILPGGYFKLCVSIISLSASEPIDDYCDEIESDLSQFLYLVSPFDKDSIPTPQPLLIWAHSEAFDILAQGEYFRMIVVELNSDQQAEEGVATNSPLFMKNYLSSHQLQYPIDAKTLVSGKRYGWQVQKMFNDIIINKSEAWEFVLAPARKEIANKYAILKKKLDAGYYTAYDDKLYFRFVEDYNVNVIKCNIYDSKRTPITPRVRKDEEIKSKAIDLKSSGYNRFEIDLNALSISSGFHTLEIKNEKGELFMLKFYVE